MSDALVEVFDKKLGEILFSRCFMKGKQYPWLVKRPTSPTGEIKAALVTGQDYPMEKITLKRLKFVGMGRNSSQGTYLDIFSPWKINGSLNTPQRLIGADIRVFANTEDRDNFFTECVQRYVYVYVYVFIRRRRVI